MVRKRRGKFAAVILSIVLLMGLFTVDVHADSWVFGEEYPVHLKDEFHDFAFTLSERNHVHIVILANDSTLTIEIFDGSDNKVSSNKEHTTCYWNSGYKKNEYHHSATLNEGTYYIRVDAGSEYSSYVFYATAEPIISLPAPAITGITNPSNGKITVKCSSISEALGYVFSYSKVSRFIPETVMNSHVNAKSITGLQTDSYYYVRVRAYTTFSDGLKVFSNWSRPKLAYVNKPTNKVTITASNKTYKYKDLKKKKKTFKVTAKNTVGSKQTFYLSSVPKAAKKYLSINKSTGVVTVKKGIPVGTYKIKILVKAAATVSYKAASATKTISLKIKKK